ncbi:keratin-associated protein 9-6-like [Eleutherodactylus coqui]|uniref:keratin-associated protein 9-6-like n=1 Tax=Eleutherodactylus coqui TaxID=57060 RepID=UPI003462D2A3
MAQFRMTTILLFVGLSLCFEFAQSELKCMDSPCMTSAECMSSCCYIYQPNGMGTCVDYMYKSCFGPDNGNQCYSSDGCNSGCCKISQPLEYARCVPKLEGQKCLGQEDGDLCYTSEECKSGCCHSRAISWMVPTCVPKRNKNECFGSDYGDLCYLSMQCKSGCCRKNTCKLFAETGRCARRAAEDEFCTKMIHFQVNQHCQCEDGLTCDNSAPGTQRGFCKKPASANKCL